MSLKGLADMHTESKTLHIPLTNILSAARLSEIMGLLADGKFILHDNKIVNL